MDLNEEKMAVLNTIFLKKYNGFTAEEIDFIQKEGQGISFLEIVSFFAYLGEHVDEIQAHKDYIMENLNGVISCLYTCDELISSFSEFGSYSEIPPLIEFRINKGLEPDYVFDYEALIRNCIFKNDSYNSLSLYCMYYEKITPELKKEMFEFLINSKENMFGVSEDNVLGFIDLLKYGHGIGKDISELWKLVSTEALIILCTNEEEEIINLFYDKVEEKDKKLIDAFKVIKEGKNITEELVNGLLYSVGDYSANHAIAKFAIKKGYIPPVKTFDPYFFNDDYIIDTLSNVNLAFYLLTKENNTTSYANDRIYQALKSSDSKKAFQILREYELTSNSYGGYSTSNIIYELGDLLLTENLSKYFDDKGMKIDFMYEVLDCYFNKLSNPNNNSFITFTINKCKDQIPKEQQQYYQFLMMVLNANDNYASIGFASSLKSIAKTKDEFTSFISNQDKVIDFIKENYYCLEMKFGLLKIGVLNESNLPKIFSKGEAASLEVIKELLDQEPIDFEVCKNIHQSSNLFNKNGMQNDKLINFLLENNYVQAVISLSNKYVTDEQRVFLQVTSKIFEIKDFDDYDKRKFIFDAINNHEQLSKYIVNNKPTKELIDKLFEVGYLECLEGYEDLLTDKQKMIYEVFKSIPSKELQEVYSDFISNSFASIYSGIIPEETIKIIPELLTQIKLSNSSEVAGRYINIAKLILQNTNEQNKDPLRQFKKIEKIFLTKDLSHMDKIFKSFQLLYPHKKLIETIQYKGKTISPTLYQYATNPEGTILGKEAKRLYGDSTYAVEMVMYADLLKTTIASNDKTFIDYIEDIERGNALFYQLMSGEKSIQTLEANEKYILNTYVYHLEKLYNKNNPGNSIKLTNDLERNLSLLMVLYKDVDISLIPDQIIKNNYYTYLGISTMQELKDIMNRAKEDANKKGYEYAKRPMVLEKGDIIKGIGDITYFDTIIQNGSVSKEFLGGDIGSDLTPFDTDLSYIPETKKDNAETREGLDANSYGPIFFVIKDAENKYNCTRGDDTKPFELVETSEEFKKIELFRTLGGTHFGIRTGFATSQVDYICCEDKLLIDKIGLILAKNGFYIPVVNKEGNLLFTPGQYEQLRGKMAGLSYYGVDTFDVASTTKNSCTITLATQIKENIIETRKVKEELEERLRSGFALSGLIMKTQIDGDMQPGSVELIDTGSTGRGTNQIGDGDFDFMIRLDKIINRDQVAVSEVAKKVCAALGIEPQGGDLRKAKIPVGDKVVELDISYATKSDRITYTTDMSLTDRLETIKKQDPEQYLLVLANIVLAKKLLKEGGCYKPHHAGETPQGGLGGVGTESWILQNGGSLEEAATEFLIASGVMRIEETENGKEVVIDENAQRDYDTFKNSYSIWDFGQNQMTETRARDFPYDNFVYNNMNKDGYSKMVKVMQTYMLELHPEIKFVPKPISPNESQAEKEEREKIESATARIRTLLQGLNQMTYSDSESITTGKGK